MTWTERNQTIAWFYEIRDSDNTVVKRDGGFADQNAAKAAARADARKMRSSRLRLKGRHFGGQARQSDKPDIGRILVGQDVENPTR